MFLLFDVFCRLMKTQTTRLGKRSDTRWRASSVAENPKKKDHDEFSLKESLIRKGIDVRDDPRNSSSDHFCGSCCYGCRSGDKKGVDSTWLVDAVESGAVIRTGCKAEKLILVRDDIQEFRKRGVGVIASVGKKFPLMIASGLENKNIGRNLHLHPVLFVWGYFPESRVELKGKSFEGGIITSIHKVRTSFSALSSPWLSRHKMKERMAKYGSVFAMTDVEEFLDSVTASGGPMSRAEQWSVYCSAHQMGSCRMGADEEGGVVDENRECWEAEGLFVCDGSVLPTALGVNPMITIRSIAYCIASRLANSLKKN